MKKNITIAYAILLITKIGTLHTIDEMESITTNRSGNSFQPGDHVSSEILERTLARARARIDRNWAYRPEKTESTQSNSTRIVFQKKSIGEKISDFFSNLFGKKSTIDNALAQHSLHSRGTDVNALKTQQDRATFESMSLDQQEESINTWVTAERKNFELQEKANEIALNKDRKTYQEVTAKFNKEVKRIKEVNRDAIATINKMLTKVLDNFSDVEISGDYVKEIMRSLKEVSSTDLTKNKQPVLRLQRSIDQLISVLDINNFSTDRAQLVIEIRENLQKSLKTVLDNDAQIRQYYAENDKLKEKIKEDHLKRQLLNQDYFNKRLIHFRNEIQSLLPKNIELRYNHTTGLFEFHKRSEDQPADDAPEQSVGDSGMFNPRSARSNEPVRVTNLTNNLEAYGSLSRADQIATINDAFANFESLTPEQQSMVRGIALSTGIYRELSPAAKNTLLSIQNKELRAANTQSAQSSPATPSESTESTDRDAHFNNLLAQQIETPDQPIGWDDDWSIPNTPSMPGSPTSDTTDDNDSYNNLLMGMAQRAG